GSRERSPTIGSGAASPLSGPRPSSSPPAASVEPSPSPATAGSTRGTGTRWPLSVRGILVTEGVRGEGGVLRNREGRRFMFDHIPELYANQTATDEEEGWRYCQGDKNARRPPELLTRDHVARCINREVKAGRGSPHGGVFLDIAWIKTKLPNAADHIKRKLPSMYHQFKQLANLDITEVPMEVGPTTHYTMGGIKVD